MAEEVATKITINDVDYNIADLSENATNQLKGMQIARAEMKRLTVQLALVETASNAYGTALSADLPKKDHIAACITLLELQGGMMQSEIRRLEERNIQLDNKHPYVMVTKGKTKHRKRLIPIILGLDFIQENFEIESH